MYKSNEIIETTKFNYKAVGPVLHDLFYTSVIEYDMFTCDSPASTF